MPKIKSVICIVGFLFTFHCPILFAAFQDIGIGARPLGLGGAFVALADDSNAATYNAAGLGYIDRFQLSLTTAQEFTGLITYNYVGAILPLGTAGSLGTSIGILSEDADIYQEQTIRLSYGKTISSKFAFGVNLKSLGARFDEENEFVISNEYFADTSASAFSFDVGALVKPVAGLNIGLSAENLVPADVTISESEEDNVPVNVRVGLAYSLGAIAASTQQESLRNILKSGVGLIEIALRDGSQHIHAGAEVWLNKSIGVRAGYAVKSGVNSVTTIALGASAKIPVSALDLQFDYAFQVLSGDIEDNTTQRFSLNLLF